MLSMVSRSPAARSEGGSGVLRLLAWAMRGLGLLVGTALAAFVLEILRPRRRRY